MKNNMDLKMNLFLYHHSIFLIGSKKQYYGMEYIIEVDYLTDLRNTWLFKVLRYHYEWNPFYDVDSLSKLRWMLSVWKCSKM